MFRIDTPNKAVDLFGTGKHGFRDGNLALGINPTELSAAQQNALQEELAGVCEAAGIVLNKENNQQLLEAIQRLIDAQSGNYALDTGAANAYVVALSPAILAYADGMTVRIKAVNANTGASTLNAGAGVVALVNDVGVALVEGDVPAGGVFTAMYIASAGKFYITGLVPSQAMSQVAADARYAPIAFSQFGGTISGNVTLTAADSGKWFSHTAGIVTLPTGSGLRFRFIGESPGTGSIIAGVPTGFPNGLVIGAGGTIISVATYASIELVSVAGAYYVQSMSGVIHARSIATGSAILGGADAGALSAVIHGAQQWKRMSGGDTQHYIDGPGGQIVFRNNAVTFNNFTIADNGDVVVTRGLFSAPNLFAQSQTWQNLTGSRASATLYTNSTGRPIEVNIFGLNNGAAGTFQVNGVIAGVLNTTTNSFVSAIVPAGSTYQLTGGNGIVIWSELR